jgi:hypothetical protein
MAKRRTKAAMTAANEELAAIAATEGGVEPTERELASTALLDAPSKSPSAMDAVGSRSYPTPDDPFEFKTLAAGSNRVRYGVSHKAKAYFLLFDENPNKGREPGDPHPVIDRLKADGWKWRPTPNGILAWKKPWNAADYSFAEDQRLRAYATDVAEELGGPVGRSF